MEPSELEKNLTDLEEKIERTRALYEQYFAGIEKLEPQIPRKDCERAIVMLRKEQIRNTAMRFKFQTLIQRYNTMQQHWSRIMREIENGTFKRDLIKAAARFGVDDALTAVGKKHAERLRKAVEKRGGKQAKRGSEEEMYEELSSSDLQVEDGDFDDDAPTPPPQRARPVYEIPDEPDPNAYAAAAADEGATYAGEAEPAAHRGGYGGYGQEAMRPGTAHDERFAPSFQIPDPFAGSDSIPPPAPGQAAQASAPPAAAPAKKGGLRWGGGGARRADPEALKRIASLAGAEPEVVDSMVAPRRELSPTVEQPPGGRRPLLSSPLDLGLPDETALADEPPRKPAPAEARRPVSPSGELPRKPLSPSGELAKPLLSAPLDLDLGFPPSDRPPPMNEPKAKEAKAEPAKAESAAPNPEAGPKPDAEPAKKLGLQRPGTAGQGAGRPQLRPPPTNEGASRPAAPAKREFGDLNDQRLREIDGQYVQTRRERNESTAGITFEKLADSLKSQADKLRDKHNKRVDYEIVVKDGKTLIKPIVK